QIAAFSTARAHLAEGGIFGFDVFYPNFARLYDTSGGGEILEAEWTDNEGRTVRRFYVRDRVDKLNQVIHGSFIFRKYAGGRLVSEETSPLVMSYYTYLQLLLLLKMTGFEITQEYGNFDRAPITTLKEIIILARAV